MNHLTFATTTSELQTNPRSRPALSLTAYCQYHKQDYAGAADTYEKLVKFYPDVEEYKVHHAQSLWKAASYADAQRAALAAEEAEQAERMTKLQAMVKLDQDDIAGARALMEDLVEDDPEVQVILGCCLYKEDDFKAAKDKFTEAMGSLGSQSDLMYSIALCCYRTHQYGLALKYIADIIEKGIREHPELSVGSTTEGMDVKSVGNTQTLAETALVEAFNLKAAIEYVMGNNDAAKEALSDMPPRAEDELDAVTLHNQALLAMETDPEDGFAKLGFLLSNSPCPPETFGNLVLLYCKHEQYDMASAVLAENTHLTMESLSHDQFEFLNGLIVSQTAPAEAFEIFENLGKKHVDHLRNLTKQVQDARNARDSDSIKTAIKDYDTALERRYIPVLMAQAKLYWEKENYAAVERILKQSAEFCSEHEVYRLNMAHVNFIQEKKYKEAIEFYEPIVRRYGENLLEVQAMVLANLCVSYIMTSANDEAEELMRLIEKEEERSIAMEPTKQVFHSCIVNLVVGVLYCSKGNFEFGIGRVIKALEEFERKLGTDTWFYAKRAVLALFETLAKQLIMLKDSVMDNILKFLMGCEQYGLNIPSTIEVTSFGLEPVDPEEAKKKTVAYEARLLRRLLMQIRAGA